MIYLSLDGNDVANNMKSNIRNGSLIEKEEEEKSKHNRNYARDYYGFSSLCHTRTDDTRLMYRAVQQRRQVTFSSVVGFSTQFEVITKPIRTGLAIIFSGSCRDARLRHEVGYDFIFRIKQ